jgi:hypothetical protein
MSDTKNEKQAMSLTVTDGLTVTILPDSNHEFLMTTQTVAKGYGLTDGTLRSHASLNKTELIEGKHFVKAVEYLNTLPKGVQPHQTLWTKRGIVRLGFFIKTDRAVMFRNWAEDLIINVMGQKLPALPESPKRNHNRLTTDRLLDIMADVCRIDDKELRLSISDKLMKGGRL